MEPLWSPVVATGGNRRQIDRRLKPQKQAKTVATGCHQLPATFHGKQGVCRELSPVAGGPLPAKEEVALLHPFGGSWQLDRCSRQTSSSASAAQSRTSPSTIASAASRETPSSASARAASESGTFNIPSSTCSSRTGWSPARSSACSSAC